MAIARPITKTIISTTAWGIPVTDAVNANTAAIAGNVPTPWTLATLVNGWTNYNGGFHTAAYRKIGDIVYVRGLITTGTIPSVAFVLPTGFRPTAILQFPTSSGGSFAWFQVNPDGSVIPNNGSPTAFNINFIFATT